MIGNLPPSNNYGHAMPYANASAYHRPASTDTWSELVARLENAVKDGRLTQAKANQILAHLAQKHNVNQ
jgi:hypothetical protein